MNTKKVFEVINLLERDGWYLFSIKGDIANSNTSKRKEK